MTPDQQSVYRILLVSLRDNLNATLTPDDCRIILQMLQARPPSPKLVTKLEKTASNLLDEISGFTGDIERIRKNLKGRFGPWD